MAIIAANLDGNIAAMTTAKKLVWMPAHQGVGAIGTALKSNGRPITPLEWRANRLVDAIAKFEASRGMAPQTTVDLLTSATALVRHTAAQVGAATYLANNQSEPCQLASGKIVQRTIRDVQEAPKKVKGPKAASKPGAEPLPVPAETVSDWDTEDEVHAYGPNTKRARVAEQKKRRRKAEANTLRGLISEQTTGLKTYAAGKDVADERSKEAARRLLVASNAPQGATHTPGPQNGPTTTATRCATEGASCSSLDFLASVPSQASLAPCRARPVRGNGQSQAWVTTEAIQTLLGNKRHRSCLGEELKRKNHQC